MDSERRWIETCTTGRLKYFAFGHRWTEFAEPDFNQYYSTVHRLRGNVYLRGYWQYPDYFAEIKDLIRIELEPSAAATETSLQTLALVKQVNSVSLHVRRGDYLTSGQFIGALPSAYYESAINLVKGRVIDPHFFVFSDDPAWARANIAINAPATYVSHETVDAAFDDLYRMAACQHHIVANSTFSWWAAWLSEAPSSLVVAPARWFAQLPPGSHSRLPATWISI
jgi:hypothetical protein